MKKYLYKIAALILIIFGIFYAIFTLNKFFSLGITIKFWLDFLFSVFIFSFYFFPGIHYWALSNDKSKQNKLTDTALIFTFIGMLTIVIGFLAMIIMCPPPSICDSWGFIIFSYSFYPAGFFQIIAIILLLINRFKKHNEILLMKKTLPKAILIYITILCLIILAVVIKNMLTSVPIGPETDSLFTCTGMRSAEQWNCDFWQFFKQNIIVDTVLTGLFMPQYTLIFIILSILSVFGIEKLLRGISNKK